MSVSDTNTKKQGLLSRKNVIFRLKDSKNSAMDWMVLDCKLLIAYPMCMMLLATPFCSTWFGTGILHDASKCLKELLVH